MPVILDESRHVLSHTPFLLWKSIDPLIMVVVTPLVVVAPLDLEVYSCDTLHRRDPSHPDQEQGWDQRGPPLSTTLAGGQTIGDSDMAVSTCGMPHDPPLPMMWMTWICL
jgi:hypothetical protein